jgi:hypothetical protein
MTVLNARFFMLSSRRRWCDNGMCFDVTRQHAPPRATATQQFCTVSQVILMT